MSAGDLYTIIDNQIYVTADDNRALNVYAYLQTNGDGDASDLKDAWLDQILELITGIQSVAVGHDTITVTNLDDPDDFLTETVPEGIANGTQTGDCLPRYNAFSFIYHRASRASRNGWKRIMGVPESVQVNGEVTNGGELTALSLLAVGLASALTDGSGNIWVPRIYRRDNPDASPPVVRADFGIDGVDYVGLTTQNTRKK